MWIKTNQDMDLFCVIEGPRESVERWCDSCSTSAAIRYGATKGFVIYKSPAQILFICDGKAHRVPKHELGESAFSSMRKKFLSAALKDIHGPV